jgi:hypothetical protein
MDRQTILDRLAQAERHVAEGIEHVERQRERIQQLARDGLDTGPSAVLLREFERMLTLHMEDRDRLRRTCRDLGQRLYEHDSGNRARKRNKPNRNRTPVAVGFVRK